MMRINRNYVQNRELTEYLLKNSSWGSKFFQELGVNNGENLNNVVTAVGTAGVAPVFIRYNPVAKYFEKDKSPEDAIRTRTYSAWRQPLSAALTLAVLTPVNNTWNGFLDQMAATKRVDRIDLAGKPPAKVLAPRVKAEYEYEKQLAKMRLIDLQAKGENVTWKDVWPYDNKGEFIRKRTALHQDRAFYSELNRLRADNNVVLEDAFESMSFASDAEKAKYKVIRNADLVTPKLYSECQPKAVIDVLTSKGFTAEEIAKAGITDFKSLKSKAAKELLKAKKIDFKTLREEIHLLTEKYGIEEVTKLIDADVNVKLSTSRLYQNMQGRVEELTKQIEPANITLSQGAEKVKSIKEAILKETKEIVSAIANKTADRSNPVVDKIAKMFEGYDDETLKRIAAKLENYSSIDLMKFHGETRAQVMRNVKIKYWLKTHINRAENVLKDFKKISGVVIALSVLPFSCGLLNWVYPRFMEKFLPDLANVKVVPKDAVILDPKTQNSKEVN